jgi:SAM-dependent methyltransferase
MMDTQIPLEYWLSDEGVSVLCRTEELLLTTQNDTLRASMLLRKATNCLPEIASSAFDIILCRQKALSMGDWTQRGFFTRQSLEQSTAPTVAKHHAERFQGCGHVLEICSGVGFDTAALAHTAARVTTIEANEHLAAMARQNIAAQELANVEVLCGLAENVCAELDMSTFDGLWADPSRRDEQGRRIHTPDDYAPSLAWLQSLNVRGLRGIKIAPAVNCEPHHITGAWVREWVGFGHECREQVLWKGVEGMVDGTATLLNTVGVVEQIFPPKNTTAPNLWNGDADVLTGRFLVEPHGALIRTGYLGAFFADHGWMLLDEQIAYGIAAEKPLKSSWYEAFEIVEALPFQYARLKERLTVYGWGNGTEIKKRGFPETPDEVRKKLRLPSGGEAGVVICTRKGNRHWAVLARRSGDLRD